MRQHKIIITGPVGAGKTTAIRTISDSTPILTDVISEDKNHKPKTQTTVALDYGTMLLGENDKFHFYGTPGQKRFDFMWDILSTNGIGLILLLDNTRSEPIQDMHFFLNAFKQFIADTKVVIGVTQMDMKAKPCVEEYQNQFDNSMIKPAVFCIDARVKHDISKLVQALFSHEPK